MSPPKPSEVALPDQSSSSLKSPELESQNYESSFRSLAPSDLTAGGRVSKNEEDQASLLQATGGRTEASGLASQTTPLPAAPMTCVFFIQFCEAYQINVLFPFVVFMVKFLPLLSNTHFQGNFV